MAEVLRRAGADVKKGFSLSQPKFFAEVDAMLKDVPADQWRAFLRFHTIDAASPYLSKPFADEHFAFYDQKLNGQKEQRVRWKRVLDAINENMGMALGELYVAVAFPPESKARAKELVANLQDALKARIEKLDWMSADTKKKAIEKWATFLPKIGYPGQVARLVRPQDRAGQLLRQRRRRGASTTTTTRSRRSASRPIASSGA